jgi:hypothetical protein
MARDPRLEGIQKVCWRRCSSRLLRPQTPSARTARSSGVMLTIAFRINSGIRMPSGICDLSNAFIGPIPITPTSTQKRLFPESGCEQREFLGIATSGDQFLVTNGSAQSFLGCSSFGNGACVPVRNPRRNVPWTTRRWNDKRNGFCEAIQMPKSLRTWWPINTLI